MRPMSGGADWRIGGATLRATALAVLLGVVAACTPIVSRHGYTPSEEALSQIIVGVDSKDTVADAVGRPSAAGLLADSGWYYVESRFETRGWRAPREVDRQVVAISFGGDGTVTNIERFGLERGRVIALSRRVTDSNVQGVGFLQQLLGNIGRISADQLVGN